MKVLSIIVSVLSLAATVFSLLTKNETGKKDTFSIICDEFGYFLTVILSFILLFFNLDKSFKELYLLISLCLVTISYCILMHVLIYERRKINKTSLVKYEKILSFVFIVSGLTIRYGFSYVVLLISLAVIICLYLLSFFLNKEKGVKPLEIIYIVLGSYLFASSIGIMIFNGSDINTILSGLFVMLSSIVSISELYIIKEKTLFKNVRKYNSLIEAVAYTSVYLLVISQLFVY